MRGEYKIWTLLDEIEKVYLNLSDWIGKVDLNFSGIIEKVNLNPLDIIVKLDLNIYNWIAIISIVLSLIFMLILLAGITINGIRVEGGEKGVNTVKKEVDKDPSSYPLTKKVAAQYLSNLEIEKSNIDQRNRLGRSSRYLCTLGKPRHDEFPPMSFYGPIDMHLSLARRQQLARYMDKQLRGKRKQDFVIDIEKGTIKAAISRESIRISAEVVFWVTKSEYEEKIQRNRNNNN